MKTHRIIRTLMLVVAICTAGTTLADTEAPDPATTGILGTSSGEAVYTQICQGCHMAEGRGAVGAGYYPAFAGNAKLASKNYMAATILNGRRNMPSFEQRANNEFFFEPTWLTDTQIANVVNYIRSHFGNHYSDSISAADVAALHAKEPAQ
jgi:mono/diheme cytochrome c family protein